nr:unnamed protein product [Callosobruchus analis]
MISENDLLLIGLAVALVPNEQKKLKRKRSKWVKLWKLNREKLSHVHLINELRLEPDDYRNYLRMDESVYTELLELVSPLLKKEDTIMRTAITPHERLSTTLRYLATGRNYEDLKFTTRISAQALGKIIPETCRAIIVVLKNKYCKVSKHFLFKIYKNRKNKIPKSEAEWIPNCLGAVDGKHIRIRPPSGSGAYYYNYKQFHSIVLMGIANSNYEFIMFDVGTNGRVSDGGVINNTCFYKALVEGQLKIPAVNEHNNLPYVFIGDEAFALRKDFLKPYNERELNPERSNYNKRLSRARRIIENVFGILANRFRIYHTEIGISVESIETVVMATCVLHNYLRKKNPNRYMEISADEEDKARDVLPSLQRGFGSRRFPEDAKQVRELFLQYFKNK